MGSIQSFIVAISAFINNVLIPLLFAVALLVFLYNAFRFFIIGANDTEGRESAKRLALYGILGFVFLVSIWGIVNVLVSSLGFGSERAVTPDYFGSTGGSWYDGFMIGFDLGSYFTQPEADSFGNSGASGVNSGGFSNFNSGTNSGLGNTAGQGAGSGTGTFGNQGAR